MTFMTSAVKQLRTDQIAAWIDQEWTPRRANADTLVTLWTSTSCVNDKALSKLNRTQSFEGYCYAGYREIECPVVSRIDKLDYVAVLTERVGAFVIEFMPVEGGDSVEVLVINTQYDEEGCYMTALASVPVMFHEAWTAFSNECDRLAYARELSGRVEVIGGREDSFTPTVNWDEIVLPDALKHELMNDVKSFFTKGVGVYNRLNLKPFRKLLMAGVPGTGKTMLCNALAKWALDQNYLVIYVSSARKMPNEQNGSNFGKIQYALEVAASSELPTLILLEELDAYLHEEEKALVLNVLDGAESKMNPLGTLLISTTNYPEAIDERVLKRPGRLDRIFIIPEAQTEIEVEAMLRHYLGDMWQESHAGMVEQLIGYPGAFIREVAIYALTQVAYDDLTELSYELLEESFLRLKGQIEVRDSFLKRKGVVGFARALAKGQYN